MAPYLNHFNMLQIIYLLYVLVRVTTVSSLSHDEECSALFEFKQSINHQDDDALCTASWFQTFHSWKRTSNASDASFNCCSWLGVECSTDDVYGHVIGLDLSESSLCGHINSTSTLFSLLHLQRLNLAMNDFYETQIPYEIARLKQLRSLNLSDSGFRGQIPIEISHLTKLSSLDLSRNPLKLHNPSLKNLLQNLTRLEELHLSGVDISSSVPHLLSNFSFLRSIMLYNCSLQNEFPAAILELPELKILDVASNTNLTGSFPEIRNSSLLEHLDLSLTGFFGIVPESIRNLIHLISLRLSGCFFSGPIPGSLANLTQLTVLGLGSNKFTGIVPNMVGLSELNVLALDGNRFEKGCLPNWLGKMTKLNELYLDNMNINCEIPAFLANLTKLRVLDMGNNSLGGHIPSSFFNLTQLRKLDLGENQLQGSISSSFSNFRSLQDIRLHRNNFSSMLELVIFLQLSKLETLMLGYNMISVVATSNYTNSTLPQMKILDLQSCNLKQFPSFLLFQNEIRGLLLAHNKIVGVVPAWIWNNSQETLQVIDLSYNSITGFHQHPHLFKNRLMALFLGHNTIGGLVPTWIWNNSLETLEAINLSHNYITGFHHHPHFLPWRCLQGFYIGNNQVRGPLPIPPQTTVVYSVSNNSLTGEIPQLICDVKSLRVLDLSSNNMSGTLPLCLDSLSNSLLYLNLRQNNFHGLMMNVFSNGCLLKSIDMSENGFMGKLPRSLINCTNLEVLSLEDNSFKDVFPFWLGDLAELQVLILRSNKFYGPIQGSTTVCSQFPKLRALDLSNNGLSGRFPQNYFQTWNAMKSVNVGESSVMETMMSFEIFHSITPYSMTVIHKGYKTEYGKILTIFTAIDLSCNQFEGQIPMSLQDLRGLESLNLSNNNFVGSILPSLGYLTNLESLDLSQNKLSGEIPQQFLQLGFLSIFDVSFNHLDGHIPEGKQFDTFENNSYDGNPGLCGKPLSKECQGSKASTVPTICNTFKSEPLLPSERIDWIIILCGVGSGLVVGIVIGNFLYDSYSDCFIKRKDTRIRPLRNMRRN